MTKMMPIAIGSAILLVSSTSIQAEPEECKHALERYNSALSQVEHTPHRYTRGKDDCYAEFRGLKSDQDDFEVAVSNFNLQCN
jgi:lipocalin